MYRKLNIVVQCSYIRCSLIAPNYCYHLREVALYMRYLKCLIIFIFCDSGVCWYSVMNCFRRSTPSSPLPGDWNWRQTDTLLQCIVRKVIRKWCEHFHRRKEIQAFYLIDNYISLRFCTSKGQKSKSWRDDFLQKMFSWRSVLQIKARWISVVYIIAL